MQQEINQQIWTWAEMQVDGTLPQEMQQELDQRLKADPIFAIEFREAVGIIQALRDKAQHDDFRKMVNGMAVPKPSRHYTFRSFFNNNYFRTAAVAAGVALLTSLTTMWVTSHQEQKNTTQYHLLKRELETIRRSQNALILDMKNEKSKTPAAPANYSGTGFALTNNGVFLTNYHVTSGADSVFIQTKDGSYYKAHLLTYDENADIAILQVDDKKFRFARAEVPYTFASSRRKIGSRVYTLGFPGDALVYSQGYISSRYGFRGDSLQYRLELPANPGQSGAPVLDAKGYVIGMVTGLESGVQGTTTYAVGTEAIAELLKTLPKEIRIPRNNKLSSYPRERQIEVLEQYTCAVKVYKQR